MKTKELRIQVPDGYEIDKENSTFEKIVFKKKEEKRWRDDVNKLISGYCINTVNSEILNYAEIPNHSENYNVFAIRKQAISALAMARISQIMANDKRFGGPITDDEWTNGGKFKECLSRKGNEIIKSSFYESYEFLAFHTQEQRDLFLKENEDLIKDYLMID